jgi:hypothetical protein
MADVNSDIARSELACSHLSLAAANIRALARNATDPLVRRELERAADGCDDAVSDIRGTQPTMESLET